MHLKLQKIAVPEFKDEQMPELVGAIAGSIAMLEQELPDSALIEVSALKRFGFEQYSQYLRQGLLPKPVDQRQGKSLLLSVKDLMGHSKSFR